MQNRSKKADDKEGGYDEPAKTYFIIDVVVQSPISFVKSKALSPCQGLAEFHI
jgi:hypothetical protein